MKDITLKALLAEFIGTFLLTTFVLGSLSQDNWFAPALTAALIVGLLVYLFIDLSGAQFNPAVTIGLWSIGKIALQPAVLLIAAQMVGAVVAYIGFNQIYEAADSITALTATDTLMVFFSEIAGTALLCFGIASVVFKQTPKNLSGLIIGLSLLLGASWASLGSNGIINPAVAFGLNSVSLAYVIAPLIGGVLGFNCYRWLFAIE